MDALAKVKVGINLKIVGAGSERENLEFRIKNLELSGRVEMVGPKYGDELEQIIVQAKAVIMPSLWPENMPYSVLEALALGKIVIASRVGGLKEIIQDGASGVLFKRGDSHDLAEKISEITAAGPETISLMESSIGKNIMKKFIKSTKIYKNIALDLIMFSC